MPFTSINPTNPRTNPWHFHKHFLRIVDFDKLSFLELAVLDFCLLHPHENQSKLLGYQGWVEILMITLVYSKRVGLRNNLLHSVGSFVLKGGSGIHFYTDLHFTTTSKEVKKGNYLIVHWNYKTVIFSMTSWLHFHNLFSKGNLGTFMIVCGTKLEFSAPLSTTLCQKAGVSEISTFYYNYIFKPVISTDFVICWNSFRSRNFRRTGFSADSHTQE